MCFNKRHWVLSSQVLYSSLTSTGTEVAAMTIHSLLDLNTDMESTFDFTKGKPKTAALMGLDVLFVDEARPVSNYS